MFLFISSKIKNSSHHTICLWNIWTVVTWRVISPWQKTVILVSHKGSVVSYFIWQLASLPSTEGVISDGGLPAAAADAGYGRVTTVEGEGPEVQGDPDGLESLQPLCHWQVPDRWGLVSRCQAACAAERSERRRGKRKGDCRCTVVVDEANHLTLSWLCPTLFCLLRGRVAVVLTLSTTACLLPPLRLPCSPSTPSQLVSRTSWMPTEWPPTEKSILVSHNNPVRYWKLRPWKAEPQV